MKQIHIRTTPECTKVWAIDRLWEAARHLPVKPVRIDQIAEFNEDCWFGGEAPTCREVAEHMLRVEAADLGQPIILSAEGHLMDGAHRIAKAWLRGIPAINAVRFRENPHPDSIEVHSAAI